METRTVGHMQFVLDLSLPIYEQMVNQIQRMIARGEVELGMKLPSVRDMAVQLKINPSTVVRAYQELEREGLCEKRRGQGTFITSSQAKVEEVKKQLAAEALHSFIENMRSLGITKELAQKWLEEAEWE
ncbi:GntR family transcriptional regulator [Collibacillus ludicampi]|jgi:GntR family transcriptional regulator|uniref:GntR family transcriptional regulator n=1 Tax=Collibacillus ludicampi TaxID=2771369 RepID=A0AAV4LCH1_9BACL|nr:GntR family transcriptional regulator [Collibacillus ludicampi]GIM45547.1 GntR family transcriptional regulator [Collibacillus ludicampi]